MIKKIISMYGLDICFYLFIFTIVITNLFMLRIDFAFFGITAGLVDVLICQNLRKGIEYDMLLYLS